MRKLFFVGVLFVSLFCGTSAVLAKEDGTEECDAVYLEQVVKQARGIVELGDSFLQGLQERIGEVVEAEVVIITEAFQYPILAENKEEYAEAIRHFFGHNSRPKLKND